MNVLVLKHGVNRGALAAVRSLARAGHTVGLGTDTPHGLTDVSRAVSAHHVLPRADLDRRAFAEAVGNVVQSGGYEVVFAVDDAQVLAVSEHRDLVDAVFPYPDHAKVTLALDRLEFARAAERAGLRPPWTQEATEEVLASAGDRQLVVKSRGYVALGGADEAGHRVETRIGDLEAVREWVREIEAAGGRGLLQERIDGQLIAVTLLCERGGRIVGAHQQVSERTWPVQAGVSARAVSQPVDPVLLERIARLLSELEWFGVVQLQFLVPEGGEPHVIDFNPRFYGSLGLAVHCGADFPVAWAALAAGQPTDGLIASRSGVRFHWLGGDLRAAAFERRGGLLRDVVSSMAWSRGSIRAIWSLRDPVPMLRSVELTLRGRIKRG